MTVVIGDLEWSFETKRRSSVSYFEVPFDHATTGPVRITLDGKTVEGPAIVNECCHGEVSVATS